MGACDCSEGRGIAFGRGGSEIVPTTARWAWWYVWASEGGYWTKIGIIGSKEWEFRYRLCKFDVNARALADNACGSEDIT